MTVDVSEKNLEATIEALLVAGGELSGSGMHR
jgi:hypothetical protein